MYRKGYWPSVWSRWLDFGRVLFLRVYGPRRKDLLYGTKHQNIIDFPCGTKPVSRAGKIASSCLLIVHHFIANLHITLLHKERARKRKWEATSFPGSLFFPSPGARERERDPLSRGWEEERPWERGWVRNASKQTFSIWRISESK